MKNVVRLLMFCVPALNTFECLCILCHLPVSAISISVACIRVTEDVVWSPETQLNFNYSVDSQCLMNTLASGPVARDTVKVACWYQSVPG